MQRKGVHLTTTLSRVVVFLMLISYFIRPCVYGRTSSRTTTLFTSPNLVQRRVPATYGCARTRGHIQGAAALCGSFVGSSHKKMKTKQVSTSPEVELPKTERKLKRSNTAILCTTYVLLSMSCPILLDWVKWHNGGKFGFHVAAMTFNAYIISAILGLTVTVLVRRTSFKSLIRPDMVWRFGISASLFTMGDILSFTSMKRLDTATFSLVGKAFAIFATVLLSRFMLRKHQTRMQYGLVSAVVVATGFFCNAESQARQLLLQTAGGTASLKVSIGSEWLLGLVQRTLAVLCTTLGAVCQELFLRREPGMSFMLQQCWMATGALLTSFITFHFVQNQPLMYLWQGFDNWRVIVLLLTYVCNGLTAGLMVKHLGALSKALCLPVYLGGCYLYAALSGTVVLSVPAVVAWVVSTLLILAFAVSKAYNRRHLHGRPP